MPYRAPASPPAPRTKPRVLRWARRAWKKWARRLGLVAPPRPPPPPPPPEAVTGYIEQVGPASLEGWAFSSRGLPLRFALELNGHTRLFHVERRQRADVRSVHPDAEDGSGFCLRGVDAGIDWSVALAAGELKVRANGQIIPAAHPGSVTPSAAAAERSSAHPREPDARTRQQWEALRRINAKVDTGASLPGAYRDAVSGLELDARASRSLLHSLYPRLCLASDAESLHLLREMPSPLPEGGIAAISNSWIAGLSLAYLTSHRRALEATRLLHRMPALLRTPDWLPTECLHHATRAVGAQLSAGEVSPEQAGQFANALIRLAAYQSVDWFSRLHDLHQVDALIGALRILKGIGGTAGQAGTRGVLRTLGLCPAFWERLSDVGKCSELMHARRAWENVRTALSGTPTLPAPPELIDGLTYFGSRGNHEAAQYLRELDALATFRREDDTLWPTFAEAGEGCPSGAIRLASTQSIPPTGLLLVCVVRNEMLLLPYFLAHYRKLGIPHFAFIDNRSDDGTREYLAAQPDVTLFLADADYKDAAFGVAWQQAVLGNFCLGRWVLLVDADEFLVYPNHESVALPDLVASIEADDADAVFTDLIDMYPQHDLASADLRHSGPFDAAPCFDRNPLQTWHLGSGRFSNAPSLVSALRHRLAPQAEPNAFLSQKCALLRYAPWIRLGHGIHDVANVQVHSRRYWLAHFKYHASLPSKVIEEVQRAQHFDGAVEYRHYAAMLGSTSVFWSAEESRHWESSRSFDS